MNRHDRTSLEAGRSVDYGPSRLGTIDPPLGPSFPTARVDQPRALFRVEWPTLVLAGGIYGAWILSTLAAGAGAPLWLWAPLAAWCAAWHTSLQHEVIHGHPTTSRTLNRLIAGPPLTLWLPFTLYRDAHLRHHIDDRLTDPLDDPESFYVTPVAWTSMGPLERAFRWAMQSLLGRLVLGPPWLAVRCLWTESAAAFAGDQERLLGLLRHLAQAALVLVWIQAVCGIPALVYVLAVVWPATALILLRSFAEHRPVAEPAARSVIVESRGPFAWLYLGNNLHALHHERPGLPWYALEKIYWSNRAGILMRNGDYRFTGYAEIVGRFLLRAKDSPRHPGTGGRD
ncbi:MAG: fatty acid desaturase [Alphaproteobacteria bacterium]|nr:fatty acid desaturase [Alphaproteobacteria bacterium]